LINPLRDAALSFHGVKSLRGGKSGLRKPRKDFSLRRRVSDKRPSRAPGGGCSLNAELKLSIQAHEKYRTTPNGRTLSRPGSALAKSTDWHFERAAHAAQETRKLLPGKKSAKT